MLSPNDIMNMKFDKAMGRGYKVDDVETYLRQVAGDFSALLTEKQELEQKLMVLADKLEEYKHDEESLRSALIGAQKLGDSVIRDAKAKAATLLNDAGMRANQLMDNARMTIEREQKGYVRLQREVATFKSKLQLLYKQHLELISTIPADDSLLAESTPPAPQEPARQPEEVVQDTYPDEAYDDLPDQAYEEDDAVPADDLNYTEASIESDDLDYLDNGPQDNSGFNAYEEEPPAPAPVHDSRFGPLKFGKEYSITRNDKRKK